ncbi:hypothetical protein OGAPHI_000646 [Ogataea philodendri]|uniref:Palmitoyltransferase n=1 Tax=Ogataea philodendri TaxID=1378263 RepID=A0A9P8PG02_9ASCO|nr:uncharacterized protein OGAPHI_000646 [Ogataea philodendri]KAH3670935.1 hypothetical protein OGAPHI_000646 [Ogataea philodendri]
MVTVGQICCTIASTFPKFVCTLLLVWSYYAVIFKIDLVLVENTFSAVAILVLMTLLEALCLISYYFVVAIGPGSPSDFDELRILPSDTDETPVPPAFLQENSITVKRDGGFRFCNKCKVWKPDRCHHCASCDMCVLKMDHHCPWFADCIGFKNHKLFIQFLIYCTIYIALATAISGYSLYEIYYLETVDLDKFSLHIMFVFIVGLIMGLCVLIFTAFSIYQLLINRTTIEAYESQRYRSNQNAPYVGNIFNLGYKQNWRAVMGNSLVEWLLPIRLSSSYGSGLSFEINNLVYQKLRQETELQQRLSQEISNYRSYQKQINQSALSYA